MKVKLGDCLEGRNFGGSGDWGLEAGRSLLRGVVMGGGYMVVWLRL